MIQTLIDKQDSFEIVRNKIAQILANETLSQQNLAQLQGKDSDLWKLRIYTEQATAIEQWLNNNDDRSPIINVWFDNLNFDQSSSNVVAKQKAEAIYNIDIYGLGVASETQTGFNSGDLQAALNCSRGIRLTRNILMSAYYIYLELQGIVSFRWIESITSYQPELNGRQVERIVGARIRFSVWFEEISPQVEAGILQEIDVVIKRASDGMVLAEALYE